ncbi:MAG: copper resistance protein NlpE [Pseudomonadota bacterium]|nr:copper resistance protein NlpE [Pseudomonadota bacterium]
MKFSKPFVVALISVVFAAGCNRNAEPEATPAAPVPEAAMPAVADAPAPVEQRPFMMKAFAGTFSANGNTVTLNADGTYTSKMSDAMSDGTWTADPMGTEVLLDPNSKAEADGKYAVVSDNEIRALEGGMALQREGAAQ